MMAVPFPKGPLSPLATTASIILHQPLRLCLRPASSARTPSKFVQARLDPKESLRRWSALQRTSPTEGPETVARSAASVWLDLVVGLRMSRRLSDPSGLSSGMHGPRPRGFNTRATQARAARREGQGGAAKRNTGLLPARAGRGRVSVLRREYGGQWWAEVGT